MNTQNDSKVYVEEQACFIEKGPLSVVKKCDDALKTSNEQNNGDDTLLKNNADLDERTAISNNPYIEIPIWRNRKININKTLIPLRAALFLWFASGTLSTPFFSLLLTHRGLKLTEFTSVFSMIFPFQLIVAYTSGIIIDKIGNAKLVLVCLMLGVICLVIGLLLSPDVKDSLCVERDLNLTCFNLLNYTSYLENCKYVCSINNTGYFPIQTANDNRTGFSTFSNLTDVLPGKEIFEDAYYSNRTAQFCNEICLCLDQPVTNCITTFKVRIKILYSALTLCFFSIWSTTFRFLDFAALTLAKQLNSNFGSERFYGIFGALVATLLCNFILNIDKSGTRSYYDNIFWFSVVLYVLAVISVFNIREISFPPGINLTKKTLILFTNLEILLIVLVAFVAGTGFTFNLFYNLWFLNSLEASKITIGIHIMTSSLYGLPIYVTSKWWLKNLGKKKIVIFGLLAYAISGISYSFLYHPWISLVIEITKAFSFHLYWIAIIIHCGEIAPKGFGATVIAIVGTVHFGVGRSFSVPVGGYLISIFGARITYRILAGLCFVTAVLYLAILYLKSLFSSRESEKQSKDPEEMKNRSENEA